MSRSRTGSSHNSPATAETVSWQRKAHVNTRTRLPNGDSHRTTDSCPRMQHQPRPGRERLASPCWIDSLNGLRKVSSPYACLRSPLLQPLHLHCVA